MDHVYLDYAATTPVRDEVREAMNPFLRDGFGNPSSVHRWGREAAQALERAREELPHALGAHSHEVTFVRGGTESDNIAVLGWCEARRSIGAGPTVAISAVEHHAVFEAADRAQESGMARVTRLAVSADGLVDLNEVRTALRSAPALVSVMWVNNESGMVLPIAEIADIVREDGGTLHSDAAQAIGKVPVDLSRVPLDLLSGTGHKIHGPKGTGFLFAREGTPLAPLLHGGGQERGLRPGTEDVAGAVGLSTALRLAVAEQEALAARLTALRGRMVEALRQRIEDVRVNAEPAERAPHVLSIGVGGVEDGAALVMALDLEGVAVSGGSACTSGSTRASHVMEALYGSDDPYAAIRFSFGRGTTEAEVDRAVEATAAVVDRARRPT